MSSVVDSAKQFTLLRHTLSKNHPIIAWLEQSHCTMADSLCWSNSSQRRLSCTARTAIQVSFAKSDSVITAKLQSILDNTTYQLSRVQCSTFVVNNNRMYIQSHDNTWFTKSKCHNSMTSNNQSVKFKVSYISSLQIDSTVGYAYNTHSNTAWMRDIVVWAWASCMHFSHLRENKVSKDSDY